MKKLLLLLVMLCTLLSTSSIDPKTLEIGAKAPDFKLTGTDGKTYSLASFSKAKILMIVFTCNHCPTAQAYEDRLIKFSKDYKGKGVQVVAISPNDPTAVRLDELGYTDLSDSFAEMKLRYKDKNFNFPYLYDGDTQKHRSHMEQWLHLIFLFLIKHAICNMQDVLMMSKNLPVRPKTTMP
ncbi:MAG: redoxin domain-containing protein [Spirosomataceae bacterium]